MPASARSPEEAHRLWAAYFDAGDLDALLSLYEPEATLVAQTGASVTGLRAIREVLAGFIAVKRRFEIEVGRALQSGNIALMVSSWTLQGERGGTPYDTSGRTADVLRRQPDGSWKFLIDSPYGEGA